MKSFLFILFIFSVLGGLILFAPVVKADEATASVTVENSLPVASSVSINSAGATMTLTENTTAVATATFTVTDNNGCGDIDAHATNETIAVFYRTNVAGGAACTPDAINCYSMSCTGPTACTPGGSDLTATFSCTANVQFYADPTDAGATYEASDWTATATPRDAAGTDGTPAADTIEMASLTALNVTASISYGSLALGGDTASTDQTTVVTNTGNRKIDTQVGGYGTSTGDTFSMTCTIGNTAVALEKYSLAASTAYASKTALVTDTSPDTVVTNIPKGAAQTDDIYWGMGLPSTGVGGSCSGKVVFTAINNNS